MSNIHFIFSLTASPTRARYFISYLIDPYSHIDVLLRVVPLYPQKHSHPFQTAISICSQTPHDPDRTGPQHGYKSVPERHSARPASPQSPFNQANNSIYTQYLPTQSWAKDFLDQQLPAGRTRTDGPDCLAAQTALGWLAHGANGSK